MEESLGPGEIVDRFNKELGDKKEQLQETIQKVETRMEEGLEPEKEIENLQEGYRELSKKETTFRPAQENIEQEISHKAEPKKNLENTGLIAPRKDLLGHKKHLDNEREQTLEKAEQLYQTYRQEKGLEPVETEIDIPELLDELEEQHEETNRDIRATEEYIRDLRKIKQGELDPEETVYAVPETEELIEEQIDAASRKIYKSWTEMKQKEEKVREALEEAQQQKEEGKNIDTAIKYNIRPIEGSIIWKEKALDEISSRLENIKSNLKDDISPEYAERIEDSNKAEI